MQVRWYLAFVLFISACQGATTRPLSNPLTVSDFPAPPQQTAKWELDTNSISPELVSATTTLFEQGLADPRGCDYREIEIHVGAIYRGEGGKCRTHGWVLPNAASTNQAFAVCWNGLVSPVVSMGRQASLQSDMESLASSATTNSSRMRRAFYGQAVSEKLSVAQDSLLPLKACLLLRLGERQLALKIWDGWNLSLQDSRSRPQAKDPYLMLAGDWAWSIFDRTICAHMRGDVPLALVSARKLAAIQPEIEAEAARRGFAHPQSYVSVMPQPKTVPYLPFLEQLPQLLADLERRAHEPKEKSVVEMGLANYPNQSDRIAVLIEDLDLVKARQMSQPGRVAPQDDPIVQSLIQEGNAAVEPLLKTFETDKRLTCSVGFGRDFFRDRYVLPVARATKAAVEGILQTEFRNAAEARAFWERYKGLSSEERWYQVLREDTVAQAQLVQAMAAGGQPHSEKIIVFGQGQWMEAARIIVQPNNIVSVPGSGLVRSNSLPPGQKATLRGESLRSKRNPSVTELLITNANVIADQADQLDQSQGVDAIRVGTELAGIINTWEKPAAAVPAQRLMRRAIALWPNWTTFIMSSGHDLARNIPRLTEFRVEAGDTNALAEYAAWLKSVDEEKVDEYAVAAFEPLWLYPTNPAALTVSEWLFNDPASPWSNLPWKRAAFHNPLDSDLVKLPAFHKLLARELDKKDVVGSMEYFRPDTISYQIKDLGSGSRGLRLPPGEHPAIGTKDEIRRCDWTAFLLSNAQQIPLFNPFAPLDKRDEAILKAKAALLASK